MGRPRNDGPSFGNTERDIVNQIIQKGFNKAGMDFAEKAGRSIKGVSTSQIRNAYGEITRLKMKDDVSEADILMVKPKLAYAAARADRDKSQYMYLKDILSHAIDVATEDNDPTEMSLKFKNLTALFEAILAYHKVAGGK